MSFQDVGPDPESMPDAPAEPDALAEQEPPSEPEYVGYFTGDAVEANATAAPAAATGLTEASEHWTAASLRDLPGVTAVVRDAERAVGSIFRGYDFGAGAQMRQIQDI